MIQEKQQKGKACDNRYDDDYNDNDDDDEKEDDDKNLIVHRVCKINKQGTKCKAIHVLWCCVQ